MKSADIDTLVAAARDEKTLLGLKGRSLLQDSDLKAAEFLALIDFAAELREEKRIGHEEPRLSGLNIALLFEKTSTRTRSAFEVGAADQGAHPTYIGPDESQLGKKESVKDTARVLGRMYDGIEYRGFAQSDVETLAAFAGVPVWNGLTDTWHPTQALADILTMRDHAERPPHEIKVAFVGDGQTNTAASLMTSGANVGMDVRIGAPPARQPLPEVVALATKLGSATGGTVSVTADPKEAVRGVDFVYTDVWLSMGDPPDQWDARITELLPYQVNSALLAASGNKDVKFLHCLPAMHNLDTVVGQKIGPSHNLTAFEVTDEVFESAASIVFDQAENRLHTIKALMVATLADLGG
jgi:ornithine carbamoyltransferase